MGVLNAGAMLACSLPGNRIPPESGMEVFSCFCPRGREGKRAKVSPHRATPLNLRAAAAERQNLFVSLPGPPPSPSEGEMNGLGLVFLG